MSDYKRECEERLKDVIFDYEAMCNVHVGWIQISTTWVKGPDGPEIKERTITLELVQP